MESASRSAEASEPMAALSTSLCSSTAGAGASPGSGFTDAKGQPSAVFCVMGWSLGAAPVVIQWTAEDVS
jgi:hypothetical protein